MAHAGTMDLGQSVQAKPSGNPWASIALLVAVVIAIVAGTMFALNAGLVGKAAKPADRSYDAIEAQRRAVTLSIDRSNDAIEALRGAVTLSVDRSYDAIEAHRGVVATKPLLCSSYSPTSNVLFAVECPTLSLPVAPAVRNSFTPGSFHGGTLYTADPIKPLTSDNTVKPEKPFHFGGR